MRRVPLAALAALLVSGGAFAGPVFPPGQLDPAPVRVPGVSVAALGDDVLVAWNSSAPFPYTMFWTVVRPDGSLSKPPDAGAFGEFSSWPPHVAAAPDAGLWLLVHPDKSTGGQTGSARITAAGVSLDGAGAYLGSLNFTTFARSAWANAAWWTIDRNGSLMSLFSVNTAGAVMPATLPPGLTLGDVDIAGDGDSTFISWLADGGAPQLSGKKAGSIWTTRDLGPVGAIATAVGAWNGVVLLVWTTGGEVVGTRFTSNLSAIDGSPFVIETVLNTTVRVSSDGQDFLVVWDALGSPDSDVRLARVPPSGTAAPNSVITVASGNVANPDVAGTRPGDGVVAWHEQLDGGWFPFAKRLQLAFPIDAGSDGGAADAGTVSSDAGSEDAGPGDAGSSDAGGADAGVTPIDAGAPDAAVAPIDGGGSDAGAGDYTVGCSCAAPAVDPTLLLATMLLLLGAARRPGPGRA